MSKSFQCLVYKIRRFVVAGLDAFRPSSSCWILASESFRPGSFLFYNLWRREKFSLVNLIQTNSRSKSSSKCSARNFQPKLEKLWKISNIFWNLNKFCLNFNSIEIWHSWFQSSGRHERLLHNCNGKTLKRA